MDGIYTTDAYIINTLIIMAAISLLMSRVIMEELRSVEAGQSKVEDVGVATPLPSLFASR